MILTHFYWNLNGGSCSPSEPLNKGEGWAKWGLRKRGFRKVVAIQNASGHGIDLVCRDRHGNIVFVEVKSHFLDGPPRLSRAQSNMSSFAETRLRRASQGLGHWKSVDPKTKSLADELLTELLGPPRAPIRGIVINVDHAMTWFKKSTYYEWDRGRVPTNILTNP